MMINSIKGRWGHIQEKGMVKIDFQYFQLHAKTTAGNTVLFSPRKIEDLYMKRDVDFSQLGNLSALFCYCLIKCLYYLQQKD